MEIKLSDHFTYKRLLRFTFPSILMIVFISIYLVVDGMFVSNFVGSQAFAAVNFVIPFVMGLASVGYVFGIGGSALVAKTLGEGKRYKANRIFSLIVYSAAVTGVVLGVLSFWGIERTVRGFGVSGKMLADSLLYSKILLPALPFLILQIAFQSFLIVAERPKLGLYVTLLSGFSNIILDALFIIVFGWGLKGAAWATVFSQLVGSVLPILFFIFTKHSQIKLGRTAFYPSALSKVMTNGFSELISNLSLSVVSVLYNYQLLKIAGEDGIVAFGIMSYANFVFLSIFIGYTTGNNPIISYNHGSGNHKELKNVFRKNLVMITWCGVFLVLLSELLAYPVVEIFVGYNRELTEFTAHGFRIYALAFLLSGYSLYGSAFFTALNNGVVSAIIAFVRTIVFECGCVIVLPMIFGVDGIWMSIVVAEVMALFVCVWYFYRYRHVYHYA